MFLKYLPLFVLCLFLVSCENATPSPPDQKDKPKAVQQATAPVTTQNSKFNEFTVDDAAAERIKNYLMYRFLTRDIPLMQDEDKQFQLYRVDLNEDGLHEYFVRFKSSYFCGTGGCTVLLLENNLTLINRFTVMQTPLYLSQKKVNGWRSFLVQSEGAFRKMDFDNKKYPDNPSILEDSGLNPSDQDQILFDDKSPSKVYFFSEDPTAAAIKKGIAQRRATVFQRTYNAGTFEFKVNATNGDQTPIHISTVNLPRPYKETIEVKGGVKEGHLLDLNADGFKELYLIIQATSGNLDLVGVASYRDKSAGAIKINDTEETRQVNSDRVFVENGELRRSFLQDGKKMDFKYKLEKGETGFMLKPVDF